MRAETIDEEILGILKQFPRPISTREISLRIKRAWHSVNTHCLRLQLEGRVTGFKISNINVWQPLPEAPARREATCILLLSMIAALLLSTGSASAGFAAYDISNNISAGAASTAGEGPGQKNLVRLDDESLVAVWEDDNNDIRCAQSSDRGLTWFNETVWATGTYRWPSIATNGTRIIIIAESTGNSNVVHNTSDRGCAGVSVMGDATSLTGTYSKPAVGYDGTKNQWVLCAAGAASDTFFANVTVGSEGGNWTAVEVADARTTDACAVDVSDAGNIFVVVDDSQGNPDSIRLYNSTNNFISSTSQSVLTGSGTNTITDVSINVRGSHVLIAAEIANDDIAVIYSTDSGLNFTSTSLSADAADVSGCIDGNGLYHLVFREEVNDYLGYVNHSGAGGFGAVLTVYNSSSTSNPIRYTTGRCSNFPRNNRMNYGQLEVTFLDRDNTPSFDVGVYTFGNGTPTGSFASPASLQNFMINTTINITFSESAGNATIANVTFLLNGTVRYGVNDTTNVWSLNHTIPMNTSKGNLTITAFLYDDATFLIGTSSRTVIVTPLLAGINASPSPVRGGNTINITPLGVNDSASSSLNFYCSETTQSPTAAAMNCTAGAAFSYPYAGMFCSYTSPQDDRNHTASCRVFDGSLYSATVQVNYTTDSTPPSTALTSVAGDREPAYFDNVNDGQTIILLAGESGMACRFYTTDTPYTANQGTSCAVSGVQANCTPSTTAEGADVYNFYISCADSLGNGQNATQNIDITDFVTDWTPPNTTDTSNASVQLPGYNTTILESDNVDGDPSTLYCLDAANTCTPSTVTDNGSQIAFNSSLRGANFLRLNSTDDAGNSNITNRTININRLPVLTSADDSAGIVRGGSNITITTVSNESDGDLGQVLFLYVCNTSVASAAGCAGSLLCSNSTTKVNASCTFASQSASAVQTWFAFVFDNSSEAATANPLSGTFTTDIDPPVITVVDPVNTTYTQSSVTAQISLGEAGASAVYSPDGGANVTMTMVSSTLWTATLTGLANQQHSVVFFANDTVGNGGNSSTIYFTVDTTANDTAGPSIVVLSPLNNSYHRTPVLLNISLGENGSAAWYSLDGAANVTLGNTSPTLWNSTITPSQGSHTIIFFANDTSTNRNTGNSLSVSFTFDTISPSFSGIGHVPQAPNTTSSNVTCHSSWTDAVGLAFGIIEQNSSGTFRNTTVSLSGTGADVNLTIPAANLTPGGVTCTFSVNDTAGNLNSTSVSFTVTDATAPSITNVSFSPSSAADLDPPVAVNVTANVTDNANLSTILLQYREANASSFLNVTMDNLSGNLYTATFNANTTNNWTFQVLARDGSGNQETSPTVTISVSPDKTWNLTETLPAVKSIVTTDNRIITLGDITIHNTGDAVLTANLSSDTSWITFNGTSSATLAVTLLNGTSLSIVNVTANTTGFAVGLFNFTITVTANDTTSSPSSTQLSGQVNIQNTPGPFLVVSITTFTSSVTKGQSAITYTSQVDNLGTQDATGAWLAWSLPPAFTLESGTLNRSVGSLPVGASATNTIAIGVSPSAADTQVTINATANSTQQAGSTSSKTVTIGNPVPASSGGSGSSSSSGSGGGSSISRETIIEQVLKGREIVHSVEVIELVRGKSESFPVAVTNTFEKTVLSDVAMRIDGFLSPYLAISPPSFGAIPHGETREFTVTITSPSYLEAGTHELTMIITGTIIGNNIEKEFLERRRLTLIVYGISSDEALQLIEEAEAAFSALKSAGFPVTQLWRLLASAEKALVERDFEKVQNIIVQIRGMKDAAFEADKLIRDVKGRLSIPLTGAFAGVGGNRQTEKLIRLAEAAFGREDFETALQRAREAQLSLAAEQQEFNPVVFVVSSWWNILLTAVVGVVTAKVGYSRHLKATISGKVRDLAKEEEAIHSLMRGAQIQRFERGRMSDAAYRDAMARHEKQLARVRKERIALRNRRVRLLHPSRLLKDLDRETAEVMASLKALQRAYLEKGTMTRKAYHEAEKQLHERLAEIEDERMLFHSAAVRPLPGGGT